MTLLRRYWLPILTGAVLCLLLLLVAKAGW